MKDREVDVRIIGVIETTCLFFIKGCVELLSGSYADTNLSGRPLSYPTIAIDHITTIEAMNNSKHIMSVQPRSAIGPFMIR